MKKKRNSEKKLEVKKRNDPERASLAESANSGRQ